LDVAVWRLNQDGTLDTTFGTGGAAVLALPGEQQANAVAVQKDGRIVVAGYTEESNDRNFLVARFDSNRAVDTSSGGTGFVTFSFGDRVQDEASAVGLQKNGKIVVAGTTFGSISLARLKSDGAFDPSFGTGGKTGAFFTGTLAGGQVTAMAIQKD